jgi:uncharacterized membrane protein YbhN (UPF0104 family)
MMPTSLDNPPAPASDSEEQPALDEQKASRSLRRGLISAAVLIAIVVGLVLAVPRLHGVGHTVAHLQGSWIVAAIPLEILSCYGYALAFLLVFERVPLRFGGRVALSELAFGAAVSLGGAGSLAVGAWLLIDRGGKPRPVAERSAVLFLLTSAVNLITLTLVGVGLFTGILPGPHNPLLSLLPAGVGVAGLAFFLSLPRLAERGLIKRAPGRIQTLLELTAESIHDTRDLLLKPNWRLVGALAYLWCDMGVLVMCFAATGRSPPIAEIVLAYQIGQLSNIIPVPGNIGTLDGSMIGMLVIYGVSATPAAAAVVVYHAIALWVPALLGTIAFLLLRHTRHEPLIARATGIERRRLHAERHARNS